MYEVKPLVSPISPPVIDVVDEKPYIRRRRYEFQGRYIIANYFKVWMIRSQADSLWETEISVFARWPNVSLTHPLTSPCAYIEHALWRLLRYWCKIQLLFQQQQVNTVQWILLCLVMRQ